MQVNEGDTTDPIEAGHSEGDYTTYEIEEKVGTHCSTLILTLAQKIYRAPLKRFS